jgi:hypothetical protein
MMRRILNYVFLSFFAVAPSLWAGNIDVGSSWLKVPTSAEAAGMGGAFSAVGNNVNSLEVNPAGLGLMDGQELSLMHDIWIQDLSTEHVAYGQNFGDHSGGAIGVDYINFGSVDKYTVISGVPVAGGTYSPMAANVVAGYGRELIQGLWGGATFKFLTQNLNTTSSSTVAGDLGFLYQLPKQGPTFALVLSNLGGNLDSATLPTQVRLGAAYQASFSNETNPKAGTTILEPPQHQITFSVDGNLSLASMDASSFSLGGEYWYQDTFAARVGYHLASYGDLGGLTGLCLGAGVRYKNFELDYALTTMGDLGSTHQLSLLTRF